MQPKILKLDIDGVLRDIVSPFLIKLYQEKGILVGLCDLKCFFFEKTIDERFNINSREFILEHAKEIFLDDAKPYPNVVEDLKILRKYFDEIKLVSAQWTSETEALTDKWLTKYKIDKLVDDIIYTRNKEQIKGDIFVDDHIRNLINSKDPIKICRWQPWNECLRSGHICFDKCNNVNKIPVIKELIDIFGCIPADI